MTQRIGHAPLGADVESDGQVKYAFHSALLDLVVSDTNLVTDHFIVLTDLNPGTTDYYRAISAYRVRSIFSLGQREGDVSASFSRLWLTYGDRPYIVCKRLTAL